MDPKLSTKIQQRDQILDRVRHVLISNLKVRREPDEIDPDTPLFGTGIGLDSVDAVELVVSLEVEFGIQMPNDAIGRLTMRTVNTLADLVIEQQEGHQNA